MAKRNSNKIIPDERIPDISYMVEYMNGYQADGKEGITVAVGMRNRGLAMLQSMGLEVVYSNEYTAKGVCPICGSSDSPYTEQCYADRHNMYYDQFPRSKQRELTKRAIIGVPELNNRKLFIHETVDNIKKFWLANPHSNLYELLCQITGNVDLGFESDEKFAGDLEFEIEQMVSDQHKDELAFCFRIPGASSNDGALVGTPIPASAPSMEAT